MASLGMLCSSGRASSSLLVGKPRQELSPESSVWTLSSVVSFCRLQLVDGL